MGDSRLSSNIDPFSLWLAREANLMVLPFRRHWITPNVTPPPNIKWKYTNTIDFWFLGFGIDVFDFVFEADYNVNVVIHL